MKQGWELKPLKDFLEVQNGYAFNSKLFNDIDGVPLVRIRDLKNGKNTKVKYVGEYDPKYLVKKGNLLIGMDGEFSCYEWTGDDALLNQRVCRLQDFDHNLLPKFLFYGINKYLKDIEDVTSYTTVKHISSKQIKEIPFPIPPLDEQKRIVAKLDECFEAIDKARANVEKNLNNAEELFQSQLNNIFSQKGDGWEEKKLGEVCDLARGHNPPKKDFIYEPKEGYVRFYQIRDGWSDKYKVYVPNTTKLHRVDENEILMVAYRHIGRRFRGAVGAFNVALCKITNKDKSILEDDYLYHIIPTDYVRGELLKRSERSLIPSMSVKHLMNIVIPLPSIEEQKKIVITITKLQSQTQSLESNYQQELDALDELKKSILQKAFNGEL